MKTLGVLPGETVHMIRKIVVCVFVCVLICVHVCAHVSVWLVRKDFAYYSPFPQDQSLIYGPEQSSHNTICIFPFIPSLYTGDKKLRECKWVGVVFYCSSKRKITEETCN